MLRLYTCYPTPESVVNYLPVLPYRSIAKNLLDVGILTDFTNETDSESLVLLIEYFERLHIPYLTLLPESIIPELTELANEDVFYQIISSVIKEPEYKSNPHIYSLILDNVLRFAPKVLGRLEKKYFCFMKRINHLTDYDILLTLTDCNNPLSSNAVLDIDNYNHRELVYINPTNIFRFSDVDKAAEWFLNETDLVLDPVYSENKTRMYSLIKDRIMCCDSMIDVKMISKLSYWQRDKIAKEYLSLTLDESNKEDFLPLLSDNKLVKFLISKLLFRHKIPDYLFTNRKIAIYFCRLVSKICAKFEDQDRISNKYLAELLKHLTIKEIVEFSGNVIKRNKLTELMPSTSKSARK